jgi:hypothetical protein
VITLKNLLNIICTEAFEHGGIPEVPDHKLGESNHYAQPKRAARGYLTHEGTPSRSEQLPVFRYRLRLVREPDGSLRWIE